MICACAAASSRAKVQTVHQVADKKELEAPKVAKRSIRIAHTGVCNTNIRVSLSLEKRTATRGLWLQRNRAF